MMFVLQHLITPTLHIPALIVLIALLFIPIRFAVHRAIQLLDMLPIATQVWFIGLISIWGIFLYLQGPVTPPNITGWADVSILSAIEPVSKFITVVIVGASGFGNLLIVAIGTQSPIHTRFVSVTLFFSAYLVIGLFIYADYGMSVDEIFERETSLVSANYVVQNFNPDLAVEWFGEDVEDIRTYRDRHYGVAFQLPLAMVESLNNWDDDIRDAWIYRHFAVFLLVFCGVVTFYRLAYEKFSSWRLGLIGAMLLVFTPHIFGQTFNNIKDPVFMTAFTIALYCGMRYWRQKSIRNALIFGAVAAFASNVRIVTIFLVIFIVSYVIILELFSPKGYTNKRTKRQTLLSVGAIFISFLPLQVLFFPASWSNPLYFNIETLVVFAKYTKWDGFIVYMGEWIRGQDVPWHYLPVWLMMTIPLTYQILFLIGGVSIARLMMTKRFRLMTDERREEAIFFTLFIAPILGLILIGATMYNDWRQFYFLYIPYLLVVLYATRLLWGIYIDSKTRLFIKQVLIGGVIVFGIYQAYLGYWMIANHPYQNVFRTTPMVELFGGRENFDRDMSRSVTRQGYEYVLEMDDRNPLLVCALGNSIGYGSQILSQPDRERLEVISCDAGAQYAILTYRNPFDDFNLPPAIYTIEVDGLTILSVHRLSE